VTVPVLTVGLPCYRVEQIAWLALEGLCRQQDAPPWELIILEEDEPEAFGARRLAEYLPGLYAAGCVRIEYGALPEHMPLARKWLTIAHAATQASELLLLQGADDYPGPRRLADTWGTWEAREDPDTNWLQWPLGLFADLTCGCSDLRRYDLHTEGYGFKTGGARVAGLGMAARLDVVRQIPGEEVLPGRDHRRRLRRGVDGWLIRCVAKTAGGLLRLAEIPTVDWTRGLYTDGFNSLSLTRTGMSGPFSPVDTTLRDVVPDDVASRLESLQDAARRAWMSRRIEDLSAPGWRADLVQAALGAVRGA